MSRSRIGAWMMAILASVVWLADADALVVVRDLNLANDGLGALYAGAIDVAAGSDDVLQFVMESPDYYLDDSDDGAGYRRLLQRRLTPEDVFRGEGRVDTNGDFDTAASVVALADGFAFVWRTEEVANGVAYRRLRVGDPPFDPPMPVFGQPTIAADLAAAAVGDLVAVVWGGPSGVNGRLLAPNGTPVGPVFLVAPPSAGLPDVAAAPGVGFVVGWFDFITRESKVRPYNLSGIPLAEEAVVLSNARFAQVAATDGGMGAVVGIRADPDALGLNGPVLVARFDAATGAVIGGEIEVATATALVLPDLGFDLSGNLFVAWGRTENSAPVGLRGRAFAADGTPLGGTVVLGANPVKDRVRTSRLPDGRFVNAYVNAIGYPWADVVSLCDPGSAVCGDGVLVSTCERCDAGLANSDTTPDACRSDCTPPRCGDGVVDGGESCDDGNAAGCDGCSASCATEVGLTCGDGVVAPRGCAEACDDGNAVVGDGCSPTCALERVPGGGSNATDCYTEWRVDNPTNDPLLDKRGAFRTQQVCVDDDARCDFDGGTSGSCTFHVAVCANNVDAATCVSPNRLAAWTVERPSAAQAAKKPWLGALRAALQGAVPGAIVGPPGTDLCSPAAAIVVPLHGTAAGWHPGKVVIKTRATLYDASNDGDVLKLVCLPSL